MFRGIVVQFLLHPASRKATITQANMHSSALAPRTRKLFLQNNSSFFKHASAHRLLFTHVGQHCCFYQVQSLPLLATHGFAAELWICLPCPLRKDIFVNRGLSQGKMPAERGGKSPPSTHDLSRSHGVIYHVARWQFEHSCLAMLTLGVFCLFLSSQLHECYEHNN